MRWGAEMVKLDCCSSCRIEPQVGRDRPGQLRELPDRSAAPGSGPGASGPGPRIAGPGPGVAGPGPGLFSAFLPSVGLLVVVFVVVVVGVVVCWPPLCLASGSSSSFTGSARRN